MRLRQPVGGDEADNGVPECVLEIVVQGTGGQAITPAQFVEGRAFTFQAGQVFVQPVNLLAATRHPLPLRRSIWRCYGSRR